VPPCPARPARRGGLGATPITTAWAGAQGRANAPERVDEAGRYLGGRDNLVLWASSGDALQDADALVVVTEWKQFRSPDFAMLKGALADQVVFDGRNLYEPVEVEAAGLAYYGIGRGRSLRSPA